MAASYHRYALLGNFRKSDSEKALNNMHENRLNCGCKTVILCI